MSQADVDTVYNTHRTALGRFASDGMTAMADHFATDVVLMPPGQETIRGLEAARAWAKASDEPYTLEDVVAENEEYLDADGCIIETGDFSWTLKPKAGGAPERASGRYLAVWKRQDDGTWKVVRDIWNSGP